MKGRNMYELNYRQLGVATEIQCIFLALMSEISVVK